MFTLLTHFALKLVSKLRRHVTHVPRLLKLCNRKKSHNKYFLIGFDS